MWTAIITTLLGFLIEIQSVDALSCSYRNAFGFYQYYICSSNQYCCGTRSCCYYSRGVYSLWYFWFGIILFILICSGASGAYYRKRQRIVVRTHPAPVVQHPNAVQQTMVVSATASSGYSGYPNPPPTYNQVITTTGPNMGVTSYPMGYNSAPQGVTVHHY
ncbi:vesicular, overexpressed in cancer, prosurvival protein 1-like [Lytechinus variegatus]|uniref:vesicular, overexpressed in cancer, prosurvival protein 1-like n=1 Tax=Lytechinus variegatus TaxID=7654 RepID=UPI001BB2B154|nr:vesicular, overexpressed in cancer, prosurvival protein 1-like [Lytechinus variegatus]XP_041479273.1 vesicular, overexpressed in cancer, prosurvival protein 1-like [Lytechinus variegatus]